MRNEKGSIMVLALIGLAVGTLLLIPFSRLASSKAYSDDARANEVAERHAAEAGVEDAIWQLDKGTLAPQLPTQGSSVTYPLPYEINDKEVSVRVTRGHSAIAADDFEAGNWSGGTGWLEDWDHYGLSAVTSSGTPQQGAYHLVLNGDTDYVVRSFDPTEAIGSYARLYFWAKAKSFQSVEVVNLLLSTDQVNWTVLKTWSNGDDDNAYRFYDIDLSQYVNNAQLWIAFEAGMAGPNSYFYVDSISIVKKFQGSVLSPPSDDFESGDWLGGYHWVEGWAHSGSISITPRSPYQGQYHLEMKGPSSYADRAADLSDFETARARLWAQSSHFDLPDSVDLRVTGDGVSWYSLMKWTVDDSDWTYHSIDVDIPTGALTDQFRLAFYTNMSSSSQFIDVDNIEVWGSAYVYEIVAIAGNTSATVVISFVDGEVVVHSWRTVRSEG